MADPSIQQIKDRLSIVDVVSGYLRLEKTGINLRARCPFHSEKKPSFFVSPARQSFKCFGCAKQGDIFTFVQEIEGIEFGDALRLLAKRAGVQLQTFRPELRTKRQRLYQICEIATKFFEKQLWQSARGGQVKDYLLKRGIKEESIKKWRLGYSPDQWRTLSDFLVGKGYTREEVVEAGLAVKSEKGPTPYDRFRGRIIFPVFDLHSQVIGFGGRVFEGDENTAKYLNISNTLLYDKSKVLYGINFAKMDLRRKDACILTEGYTDVILSHQAGFTNTVASSGTSLTSFQLQILKRYTTNLLTAFDMDKAGGMATERGIDLAQQADFDVKVICMTKETDPADIISQNPAEWQKAIEQAKEIMTFYFDSACEQFDKENPKGKKQIARALLPAIKRMPNRILQSHWVQKLAGALKVSEEAIIEELKKVTFKKAPAYAVSQPTVDQPAKPEEKLREQRLEERVLALALSRPENLSLLDETSLALFSAETKTILSSCQKVKEPNQQKIREVVEKLQSKKPELAEALATCYFKNEIEPDQDVTVEIKLCLSQLKKLANKNKLSEISKEIQTAEIEGDQKKLAQLIEQFNTLATYAKSQT